MMAAESRRHEGHRPYSAGDGMRRRECKMVATSVCASFYHDGHAALEGVGASLEHIAKACRLWGCTKYTCWPQEKHNQDYYCTAAATARAGHSGWRIPPPSSVVPLLPVERRCML